MPKWVDKPIFVGVINELTIILKKDTLTLKSSFYKKT